MIQKQLTFWFFPKPLTHTDLLQIRRELSGILHKVGSYTNFVIVTHDFTLVVKLLHTKKRERKNFEITVFQKKSGETQLRRNSLQKRKNKIKKSFILRIGIRLTEVR